MLAVVLLSGHRLIICFLTDQVALSELIGNLATLCSKSRDPRLPKPIYNGPETMRRLFYAYDYIAEYRAHSHASLPCSDWP